MPVTTHLPSSALLPATTGDVDALVQLETLCFEEDRLSRRSFQRLIRSDAAAVTVLMQSGDLLGYVCVLYRRGTALARLYSLAIHPDHQGQGLSRRLMSQAEEEALAHGCTHMRLEVRPDNAAAITLYESLGYRQFGSMDNYYEDHSPALRLEKRIRVLRDSPRLAVPFFAQTTDFTCGSASLMMAMSALDSTQTLSRSRELMLWREATTIFMTSGHGGCGPHGLALAAHRQGFSVSLMLSQSGPLFLDGVRDADKKAVIELVQRDFMAALDERQVPVHYQPLGSDQLAACIGRGQIPLVLISTYRLNGSKAPHWVVVAAADELCLYIHDPDLDTHDAATATDNAYIPITRQDFDRMARFGAQGLRAAVILSTWGNSDDYSTTHVRGVD